MNIEIRDEREVGHYAAYLDGQLLGLATWVKVHDTVILPHAEVNADWAGRGVGSLLARRAFEDARAEGLSVLPFCPFMRRWAELHPSYQDVVRAVRPGELPSVNSAVHAAHTLEVVAKSAAKAVPASPAATEPVPVVPAAPTAT
ncbi:MAG TPA: GNAT family N-acetyltransferase [Actinocrinis sp.]|uniref:GNAT family N-acetyltransferase n=1 Tax=Actinocrinis sp. TaxID=1920516 RepID=UPI002DDD5737|nr:GNAT family N-acetyltransferase [Actinocrinis sp.]HEV2345821.1 GNAT family N-acetyltransferase [Actinocrinis sp.]